MFTKQRELIYIGLPLTIIFTTVLIYIVTQQFIDITTIANTLSIVLIVPIIVCCTVLLTGLIIYIYMLQIFYKQIHLMLIKLENLSEVANIQSDIHSTNIETSLHYISQIIHIPTNIFDMLKKQIKKIL